MNGILQKLKVLHGNSIRRNKKWFKRKPQKQTVTTRWRRRRESQEAEERKRNRRRCCSTQKTELLGTRKAQKELTKRGRGRPFFPRVPAPPPPAPSPFPFGTYLTRHLPGRFPAYTPAPARHTCAALVPSARASLPPARATGKAGRRGNRRKRGLG
ncbi:unnamed protein product [Sphagnum troendelagicum]